MPAKLYKNDISPPARAVMMACEVFNVPVEMVDEDVVMEDEYEVEASKRSPLPIPVLEDGENTVMDSYAILPYLADTYGKDDVLYPKDEEKRAEVDQKLMLDTGILFIKLRSIISPILNDDEKEPKEEQLNEIDEAYGFVEEFLTQTKYIAGDEITIADISFISNISSLVHILPVDATKFPKLQAWIEDIEKQPYCEKYNAPGAEKLGKLYKDKVQA